MNKPIDKEVPITIDHKPYKSPNPTTGEALYQLGHVGPDYDLWRESRGPADDELIPNDRNEIVLKPGDKFFTAQKDLNPGGLKTR